MLFLLSLVLILVLITLLLYHRVSLSLGSALLVLGWAAVGLISPCFWSLWAVIPLAVVLLVLNVSVLRRPILSAPVFGILKKSMPSMSVTEREALEAGTTWWEKDVVSGRPDWV